MTIRDQPELEVGIRDFVATVELRRPPHNFFDHVLIKGLAEAFEALDAAPECRAIVLCSQGKSFCAGADFSGDDGAGGDDGPMDNSAIAQLYTEAVRLFACRTPVVAAVHGAAIGGGLGLSMVADFRIACPESRFGANFTQLGFHPGFGLTETLPSVIGSQRANLMFLTSRRIKGEEAASWGLADLLVPQPDIRAAAWDLAREIAANAPLGVASARASLRRGLAERVRAATARELAEQTLLRETDDFREGIAASADRRTPDFRGV